MTEYDTNVSQEGSRSGETAAPYTELRDGELFTCAFWDGAQLASGGSKPEPRRGSRVSSGGVALVPHIATVRGLARDPDPLIRS